MGDEEKERKNIAGEEKKVGGEEVKKKIGRSKKVEELSKERRSSTGCIEDYLKRKREGLGEEDEEEWALRRSKKVEKLQREEGGTGREDFGKMVSELGERIMERMDMLGEEVGLLKQELMRREGLWMEEKKEMYRRIEGLEKRVVELETMREKKLGGEG